MYTGIHGVAAVCAALLGRIKSGRGQHIDMALYDCLVSMHEYAVQCYTLSGGTEVPVQTGHDLPQSTLYGVFTASDGHLVIAAQVDDAWKRFARLIGGEALAADTRFHSAGGRNANRLEILPRVRAWVGPRTVAACLAALDAIDVPSAKVQRIDETLADPQIVAARHGHRAGPSGARQGQAAEPAVPLFGLRHHAENAGAADGAAQSRASPRRSATRPPISTRWQADGVLYAEPAVKES